MLSVNRADVLAVQQWFRILEGSGGLVVGPPLSSGPLLLCMCGQKSAGLLLLAQIRMPP